MASIAEQRTSRRPVVVAVTATFVVCLMGHLAYNRFVLAPAARSESHFGPEGPGPETATARASLEKGEREAAFLRALAAAKAAEGREGCKPAPVPTEEEKAAEREAREKERLAEQARRYLKANVETLEEDLRNEKVDVEWARKTEEAARRAVASTRHGMRLEEVTCRTTFCRGRVTHADSSLRETDVMDLVAVPEFSGQVFPYAPDEEGEATTIYFARPGHTLSVMSSDSAPGLPTGSPPSSPPPSGTSAPPTKSTVEPPVKVAGG